MQLEGKIKVSKLKPHPLNSHYFDDMQDAVWDDLLKSIRSSGVTNAITIMEDGTIISGHQRVRACNVLGIDEVSYKLIEYSDEDIANQKPIKDLIESNLKQRVPGNANPIKLAECFEFLRSWYGVREGSANPKGTEIGASPTNCRSRKTLTSLAKEFGVDEKFLERAHALATLPQEIKDLVEAGTISVSTASDLIARLSPEEQEQLIQTLPATEKLTRKQVQVHIDEIRSLKQQLSVKDQELANAHDENEDLHKQLENQEVRVEKRTIIPDDYDTLKSKVENYEKKLQSQHNEYKKLFDDYTESLKRISLYEEQEGIKDFNQKLERDAVLFCSKVSGFLVDVGGYAYIPDHINLLPQNEKDAYVKSVRQLVAWGVNLIKYFNDEGMIE